MHEWWMDEQCDLELNSVDKMDEKQGMYFSQTQMVGQNEEFFFSDTSQRHWQQIIYMDEIQMDERCNP